MARLWHGNKKEDKKKQIFRRSLFYISASNKKYKLFNPPPPPQHMYSYRGCHGCALSSVVSKTTQQYPVLLKHVTLQRPFIQSHDKSTQGMQPFAQTAFYGATYRGVYLRRTSLDFLQRLQITFWRHNTCQAHAAVGMARVNGQTLL